MRPSKKRMPQFIHELRKGAEVPDLGSIRQTEGCGFHAFQAREDSGLFGLCPFPAGALNGAYRPFSLYFSYAHRHPLVTEARELQEGLWAP